MKFEIVGEVTHVETIAQGGGIRDLALLRSQHGLGNWRKKKGVAHVRLSDGSVVMAGMRRMVSAR